MNRIEALLVDDTAGDPMTGLKWTRKSTRSVSQALAAQGLAASPNTVAACLKQLDFSLQRNRKSIGETHHPQRDQQFRPAELHQGRFPGPWPARHQRR